MDAAPQHLILYDGVCGFCNRLVGFVLARDPRGLFHFASLQSALGRSIVGKHGRNPGDLDTFYVVKNYRSSAPVLLEKARAALAVCRVLGAPWSWTALLGVCPDGVLNLGYDFVARRRYRIFGRLDSCVMPRPEHKERFEDVQGI